MTSSTTINIKNCEIKKSTVMEIGQFAILWNIFENEYLANFAGCLLAILQIRNNMFHGFKEYSDLNNQIDLFKAANEVLRMVITEV